jgi:hypothetical protein
VSAALLVRELVRGGALSKIDQRATTLRLQLEIIPAAQGADRAVEVLRVEHPPRPDRMTNQAAVPNAHRLAVLRPIFPQDAELHMVAPSVSPQLVGRVLTSKACGVVDEHAQEIPLRVDVVELHLRAALVQPIGRNG